MKKQTLSESAKTVDAAHDKLVNAKRNNKAKRTMYMQSQLVLQEAEANFTKAKEALDQQLIEKI